ncbi:hypothetical protein CC77DRAFT_1095888 [Alternaria alternata]|uniref:Uncharacterized protein n=1 Tax=Alternaria alternata TaxID=5599 RepID=A0A177DI41_ALTAL|nr:hypothetical protein CC77DRAFT_1095888 [Alternaria alternata]OAG19395.1 hypothetical protein CC77DRAFT_1095888 [Alternaria alternata]
MRFQRNTKKINMGLATGKEKRGRAKRKPQISVRKISQAGSKSEPSIRVGASQDLPITLDSDDDAPARTPLRLARHHPAISLVDPTLGGFHHDFQRSQRNQDTLNGSVNAPLQNTHAPTNCVPSRSSPASTSSTKHQERIILQGTTKTQSPVSTFAYRGASSDAIQSPLSRGEAAATHKPVICRKRHRFHSATTANDGNMRTQGPRTDSRCSNASSRVQSTMMADARTSRLPTHKRSDTSTPWGTQSRAKPLMECKHGDKNMSLLDIDDFIMRSKVAQLMVVAPALAVIDLYHLIIDSEGDLPRARKQAIRMSEAPTIRYRHGLDEEGDGIMVKIDPNDPAFEWDDDEPYSEFDTATAARLSKPTLKATRSRIVKGSTRATESTKSNTKNRSNVGAKRARSTFTNPTHARETSSDRDFIVLDNVIHYDLDSDV